MASLTDIGELPLILTGYPGSLLLSIDRQLPRTQDPLTNVRSEVNSASLLVDLVLGGVGYGLAPSSVVAGRLEEELSYVPIKGLSVSWSLVASCARLRIAAVRNCQDLVVSYARSKVKSSTWPTAELIF